MSFDILISGFKTKEQAEAFYNWYEGQGEQDFATWLEYAETNLKYACVEMSIPVIFDKATETLSFSIRAVEK